MKKQKNKGGWLDKYQDGGSVPKAQDGTEVEETLTVESKDDPRYKAYQDSLEVYNSFKETEKSLLENDYKLEKHSAVKPKSLLLSRKRLKEKGIDASQWDGKGANITTKRGSKAFEALENLDPKYVKHIDKDKYKVLDLQDDMVNTNLPMQLFNKNIDPIGVTEYVDKDKYWTGTSPDNYEFNGTGNLYNVGLNIMGGSQDVRSVFNYSNAKPRQKVVVEQNSQKDRIETKLTPSKETPKRPIEEPLSQLDSYGIEPFKPNLELLTSGDIEAQPIYQHKPYNQNDKPIPLGLLQKMGIENPESQGFHYIKELNGNFKTMQTREAYRKDNLRPNDTPYPPKAQNGIKESINKYLGDPYAEAEEFASDSYLNYNDEVISTTIDNIRHAQAGRLTQEAIANKTGNIPLISDTLGFLGSNALGVGHELTTLFSNKDSRPFLTKAQEMGEDVFNNLFGSAIGAIPFMADKTKNNIIKDASHNNMIPSGKVSSGEKPVDPDRSLNFFMSTLANDPEAYDRHKNDRLKNYKNGIFNKNQTGGSLPGASGMMYGRTSSNASMEPGKLKKAQTGDTKVYDWEKIRENSPSFLENFTEPTIKPIEEKPKSFYDSLLNDAVISSGGTNEDWEKLSGMISYHESKNDPLAKQKVKKTKDNPTGIGLGRGLYQFEPNSFKTAANRAYNYSKKTGLELPQFVKDIRSKKIKEASELTPDQQKTLLLADYRDKPSAKLKAFFSGDQDDQAIEDFWVTGHWSGDNKDEQERRTSFKADALTYNNLYSKKKNGGWLDKLEDGDTITTSQEGTKFPKFFSVDKEKLNLDERAANLTKQDATSFVEKKFSLNPNNEDNKTDEEYAEERRVAREKADNNVLNQYTFESLNPENFTRENFSESALGLESQFRYDDKPNFFDDYINPLNMIGGMASNLGQAPLQAEQSSSLLPYATAIGLPLTVGALSGFGAPSTGQFVNNVVNPLAGFTGNASKTALRSSVDMVSPVGRKLREIRRAGLKEGLSEKEISKLQMNQVGITSKQREGYFPIASEIVSEYITPYGYNDVMKRIKNVPRRIIKGETNSKKLMEAFDDVPTDAQLNIDSALSQPRYDAWRLYSGLPQKNKTFRVADTSPINHPSYTPKELDELEKFSLNAEHNLKNDLPSEFGAHKIGLDIENLKVSAKDGDKKKLFAGYMVDESQRQLRKLNLMKSGRIDVTSDFNQTNVMGGYNRRYFDKKIEYNDIWDLNLKGTGVGDKFNNVDDYFGKPFLSHGQIDYDLPLTELGYHRAVSKGNKLRYDMGSNKVRAKLDPFEPLPKQKQGGVIKDDMGQWAHPGEVTEISGNTMATHGYGDNPLYVVPDVGEPRMVQANTGTQTFPGATKFTEYPMAKNGSSLVELNQLTNFTNYNTPQPGGWLDKYN